MSEKLYPEALSQDANLPAEGNEAAARALYFADAHESSSSGNKWPDFDSPDNAAKDRYYEVSHEVVRAYLATLPAPRTITGEQVNRAGWTCYGVHEPGRYATCEECREACDDLANFYNNMFRNPLANKTWTGQPEE